MLTEEVALLASDHRRKEPLTVNRPYEQRQAPTRRVEPGGEPNVRTGLKLATALATHPNFRVVVTPPQEGAGGG